MALAEIFLSAFIQVVFDKLASGSFWNLAHHEGIASQMEKWSTILVQIEAVLVDAEDTQINNRPLKLWLQNLQFLAYQLDDIVDELETEALRRRKLVAESQTSSWWRNRKLVAESKVGALAFDYRLRSRLDEITNKLEELERQKNRFQLEDNSRRRLNRPGERLETTSLMDESRIYGREADKQKVLELLFSNEARDGEVSVISILGLGGIGKTTLAQLIYNDQKVKDWFDLTVWVSVSDEFDVFKITKIIYGCVTKESRHFHNLNELHETLKVKLSSKKFLLVLDDVWNEEDQKWDLLRRPFQDGVPGSKIIVTTRNQGVALTMRSVQTFSLELLCDEDCLSLFAQHAIGAANFDGHPELKLIGESLVRKCKGLPLAVKTLGCLLRSKGSPTLKEWEYVFDSEIWDLREENYDILPALRLSYHHLPSHLKQLFVYCSIFPKDYAFDKYEIVLLWMAEGFLRQSESHKPMEDLGLEYFDKLLSRAFFQQSGGDETRCCVMHGLMNDLAQFLAGEICFRLDDKLVINEQHRDFEKARHSSFIRHRYEIFNRFKVFNRAQGLRTFLPLQIGKSHAEDDYYLSNKVVSELLPQLRCLRVLSLSGYFISEVPDSIGSLKHLRYLDLSKTLIEQVPETVCDLHNLQTLSLRSCSQLRKLPTKIGVLVNLRHLDFDDTDQLREMPLGIGKLTNLRTLTRIILGTRDGLGITALRNLSNLRGTLCIDELQNVTNVQDARDAKLLSKDLDRLMLAWDREFDDSREERREYGVLDMLKPHTKLRELCVRGYGGVKFPIWLGDPSFSNVVKLNLSDCMNCTYLPSLGKLPSLEQLTIGNMKGLKRVGVEFMYQAGSPYAVAFPSLKTLKFENMEGWEEWSCNSTNVGAVFPRLSQLIISGCSELVELSLPRLPSLVSLKIKECWEVVLRRIIDLAASITKLTIKNIQALPVLHERLLHKLRALEILKIKGCKELRCLWQGEAACENLVNLKTLVVYDCAELVSFVEEKEQALLPPSVEYADLPNPANRLSLRDLVIRGCPKLDFFPVPNMSSKTEKMGMMESFSDLEVLVIKNCSTMTCFPTGQELPTTLERLVVDCENLEPDSEKFWPLNSSSSSLQYINISGWVNLKSLPECFHSFVQLEELRISSCHGIESFQERSLPPCLRTLHIEDCDNLKWLPDEQMQSLKSLDTLIVRNCPRLESFARRGWPPNLEDLCIDIPNHWDISEGGVQGFPASILHLEFGGISLPEVVSFSDVGNLFPTSPISLIIYDFKNLESLSTGLQHLTSLKHLTIKGCPKLQDLPETLLPILSTLAIYGSPLLKHRCLKEKRDYWPMIDHMCCVEIYDDD